CLGRPDGARWHLEPERRDRSPRRCSRCQGQELAGEPRHQQLWLDVDDEHRHEGRPDDAPHPDARSGPHQPRHSAAPLSDLAGTIGVVTFVAAYVPFVGAFVSGAFAVVIALGGSGTSTAVVMLVVVLLANGLLQNIVSPFAMGSALDLNPLVVLVITIAAGCL